MSVKITDELIQEYRKYASDHDLVVEEDEDYVEDLIDVCNSHRQYSLLEQHPDFDCPCEADGPGEGEETEYGHYIDFGENPNDYHFFRCGHSRCNFGTKMHLEFDVRELPPGFIRSNVPQGHVTYH